tara:strand:- start:335 stop:712 length:378 start_codon:yes stop_codon:yes gene_type:complete
MYSLSVRIKEVPTNYEIKNYKFWKENVITDEIIENFLEFYVEEFDLAEFKSPIIPKNGSEINICLSEGADYSELVVLNNESRLWINVEGESYLEIECKLSFDHVMKYQLNHYMRDLRTRQTAEEL